MSKLRNNKKVNIVQSCITPVSFPQDIEGFENMIYKNMENAEIEKISRDFHTDLDLLIDDINDDRDGNWTAPKWITKGNILFYYYTVGSKKRSEKILREYEGSVNHDILKNLEHAVEISDRYSGKILACSEIAWPSEDCGFQDQHFKSTLFAPTKDMYRFRNPIDIKDFNEFVKISHGTITPISNDEAFQGIKKLLFKENDLPPYLENAKIGDNGFININEKNWKEISCSTNTTFIHEEQIRSYLIDYFLNEIKDYRTPILEECKCYKDNNTNNPGTVDYFAKIDSKWVPVEAKINVLGERDIYKQLSQYININTFKPTKGRNRGKIFESTFTDYCLVIDQSGVYIFFEDDFVGCEPGKPYWPRQKMVDTEQIRNNLIDIINDS